MSASDTKQSTTEIANKPKLGALSRVSLGGVLLALEAFNEQVQQWDAENSTLAHPQVERKAGDSVLIPMSEWEKAVGYKPQQKAKYAAIGLLAVSQAQLGKGERLLLKTGQKAGNLLGSLASPIVNSRLFAPARKGFQSLVERGEAETMKLVKLGQAEEVQSRALAQTAASQLIETSMDEIADNQRVQVFIQEVVQTQSLGMLDEAIEEIRERTVSGDIALEKLVRVRILRRPPREDAPLPNYKSRHRYPHASRSGAPADSSLEGHYAGGISRLFAFVCDVVILAISLGLITWVFTAANQLFGLTDLFSFLVGQDILRAATAFFAGAGVFLYVIGYYFFSLILTGQTIGKTIIGLRVVSVDGERVSFWRAIRRIIGQALTMLLLFVGFAWILFDGRRRGWHDKLSGTCVIYDWEARPDETFLVAEIER